MGDPISESWRNKFIQLAKTTASWSKDPSTKVGCVVFDSRNRVRTLGYNGFPVGVADMEERLNDRPTKYQYVVHAEANAIANAARTGVSVEGCTLLVTALHPCGDCAKLIIQSGIARVCAPLPDVDGRWADSFEIAATMFREAGVETIFY